jgi:hypothetical protein
MLRLALIVLAGSLCVGLPARAESVTDMVERAKTQAGEHRLWAPPGDNAQETIDKLVDRLNEATPEQLEALADIVHQLEASPPPPSGMKPLHGDEAAESAPQAATSRQTVPPTLPSVPLPPAQSAPAPANQAAPATGQQDAPMTTPLAGPIATPRPAMTLDPAPMTTLQPAPMTTPQPAPTTTPQPAPKTATQQAPASMSEAGPQPAAQARPPPTTPSARDLRLYELGQQAEQRGDYSAARRFNMSAARDNYAPAALALGRLYDPAYLGDHTVIGGVTPDVASARYWYGRARELGQTEAAPLLTALPAR